MAAKKPKEIPSVGSFTGSTAYTMPPMEEPDMFDRIINRIAERSKVIADLRKELADANAAYGRLQVQAESAVYDRKVAEDLAEERKTQREAAYEAQREAEARAEKAEAVMDRFRALPEFADLFGDYEPDK